MLRTDRHMHGRTDNVKTVYPPQTKFAGGIIILLKVHLNICSRHDKPTTKILAELGLTLSMAHATKVVCFAVCCCVLEISNSDVLINQNY